MVRGGDLIHFIQQGKVLFGCGVSQPFCALGFGRGLVAAIFARQESARQWTVRDDRDFVRETDRPQFALELGALDQVVMRLEAVVARQVEFVRSPQGLVNSHAAMLDAPM